MSKGTWRRVGPGLFPASKQADEALHSLKDGKLCIADVRGTRNPQQLRLFWALVSILAENSSYGSEQEAKRDLCIACGYVEHWWDRFGRLHVEAASIAYESMEQEEFNKLFRVAVDKLCEWLGTAPEQVQQQVREMVDGDLPARLERR